MKFLANKDDNILDVISYAMKLFENTYGKLPNLLIIRWSSTDLIKTFWSLDKLHTIRGCEVCFSFKEENTVSLLYIKEEITPRGKQKA